MAFIVKKDYQELYQDTLDLKRRLGRVIGRYQIIDDTAVISSETSPSSSSSSALPIVPAKKRSKLEILIARVEEHILRSSSERATEIEVFNLLLNKLRPLLAKEDNEIKEQATMILLGAILHRYFRLETAYTRSNSFFEICDISNCELFKAITRTLRLPEEYTAESSMPNLGFIDPVTIFDALLVFKEHMLGVEGKSECRYLSYPHLKKDKNFKKHLEEMIAEHKKKALPLLTQFNAIKFLVSLVENMENIHIKFQKCLDNWSLHLKNSHSDFSQLSFEEIILHLTVYKEHAFDDTERQTLVEILECMYTPYIMNKLDTKDKLASLNHNSFYEAISECYLLKEAYIVVGGYVLLLNSDQIDSNLRTELHKVLQIRKRSLRAR